jgi:3-oxoacyl-[acyl-carrier-protein] synthase II
MAMEDAELDHNHIDKERFGVVYGSGIGGMETNQRQHLNYYEAKNPKAISPFFVTMMISDIAAGQISIKYMD